VTSERLDDFAVVSAAVFKYWPRHDCSRRSDGPAAQEAGASFSSRGGYLDAPRRATEPSSHTIHPRKLTRERDYLS